jgi:hypothetical protein
VALNRTGCRVLRWGSYALLDPTGRGDIRTVQLHGGAAARVGPAALFRKLPFILVLARPSQMPASSGNAGVRARDGRIVARRVKGKSMGEAMRRWRATPRGRSRRLHRRQARPKNSIAASGFLAGRPDWMQSHPGISACAAR